ncbi:DUF7344 domain-containing protein [Haladaptatus caseinilyticus]|uniref:DUF7344 domain-containing protein n=1 Tax=Haladaptatus caseinilyticus TaxID=2993314 RepID=UPI00224B1F67|nr:hypothetical protein [Haladaptatus caseinilyticus]
MGFSPEDTDEQRSLDEIFTLLANTQRRHILTHLIETADQPVPLEALVEYLQTHTDTNPEKLQTRLHHLHLPKLADYGVIEYNSSLQLISYTEHPRLEALLQAGQSLGDGGNKSDVSESNS